jgi:hypothetical protein
MGGHLALEVVGDGELVHLSLCGMGVSRK